MLAGVKPASENEVFKACEEAIEEIHRLIHRLTMYLSAPEILYYCRSWFPV